MVAVMRVKKDEREDGKIILDAPKGPLNGLRIKLLVLTELPHELEPVRHESDPLEFSGGRTVIVPKERLRSADKVEIGARFLLQQLGNMPAHPRFKGTLELNGQKHEAEVDVGVAPHSGTHITLRWRVEVPQ
jgi:hypothetical protein